MPAQPGQIVAFPVQRQNAEDCATFREGVYQLKLEAAQMLNEVAAGTYIMSPGNIRALHRINEKCRRVGIIPLDFEAGN